MATGIRDTQRRIEELAVVYAWADGLDVKAIERLAHN